MGRQSPLESRIGIGNPKTKNKPAFSTTKPRGINYTSNLAIGAGGATTWERACLKLPSLVVTIAANQRAFAESLAEAGHLELLGDATTVSAEKSALP